MPGGQDDTSRRPVSRATLTRPADAPQEQAGHAPYQKGPSCAGGRAASCIDCRATWSTHRVPSRRRAGDSGGRNSPSRCPSSVWTLTWLISASMASTVARTVRWTGSLSALFQT